MFACALFFSYVNFDHFLGGLLGLYAINTHILDVIFVRNKYNFYQRLTFH